MKVPFVDLKANYLSIKDEIDEAIARVLETTSFIGGPFVESFEQAFAEKIGAKHCVFCASGTAALQLASYAYYLPDIITVSNSFVATAESFESMRRGSVQDFVDVKEEDALLNEELLYEKLWPGNQVVIVPVHLFGSVVEVDDIKSIYGNPESITVIEDAAQCHFGKYKDNTFVGSKNTTCFSFFPGKNMGAMGDAGILVTNHEDVYKAARMFRDHGRESKYESSIVGMNLRGDALQAAILSVKLEYILGWNEKRREHAKKYNELLKDVPQIKTPEYNDRFVYHLYVIRELNGKRDALKKFLESDGISCGIHYPIPIHRQKAFEWASIRELPITELLASQIVSLPIFPEMSDEQIEYVCSKVKEFYAQTM